jgi:hypothetical protein
MKPVPITVASLLLSAGGIIFLRPLPPASPGPQNDDGPSISRSQTGAGGVPPPFFSRAKNSTSTGGDSLNSAPARLHLEQSGALIPSKRRPIRDDSLQGSPDRDTSRKQTPLPPRGSPQKIADSQTNHGAIGPAAAVDSNEVTRPPIAVPLSATDPAVAATIPAALAEAVADSGLNGAELAEVATLAEEFVAKVTGGSNNPHDPAYQQRWANSQAESDIRMRAQYGGQAWLKHHQEAYRQALGNTQSHPAP